MSDMTLSERLNAVAENIPKQLEKVLLDIYGTYESERQEKESVRQENESVRQENESERQKVMGNLTESLEYLRDITLGDGNILLGVTYPVGAVYISFEATSPSVLFGGTWEELPSGRFLMASSGAAGTTGGSEYHMHGADTMVAEIAMDPNSSNVLQWNEVVTDNYIYYSTNKQLTLFNEPMGVSTGTCLGVKVIGSTSSQSNLPPYITVHMWKRTA